MPMMEMVLLLTTDMPGVPPEITVVSNWGQVTIIDHRTKMPIMGTHIRVRGKDEDLMAWLGPLNGFWMQKPGTHPILQQFQVVHAPEAYKPTEAEGNMEDPVLKQECLDCAKRFIKGKKSGKYICGCGANFDGVCACGRPYVGDGPLCNHCKPKEEE